MSCDHSHVPHALPHARNAYASTGPGLFGSSSSSDSSNSSMRMPDSVQRSRFSATQSQFKRLALAARRREVRSQPYARRPDGYHRPERAPRTDKHGRGRETRRPRTARDDKNNRYTITTPTARNNKNNVTQESNHHSTTSLTTMSGCSGRCWRLTASSVVATIEDTRARSLRVASLTLSAASGGHWTSQG